MRTNTLAADYCQNYDPSYGTSLNGPCRTKLLENECF